MLSNPAETVQQSGVATSLPEQLPENTPFYGFLQRPSLVDFPGKIAAVYFTSGCNFSCGYCHNARLLGARKSGITREAFTSSINKFMRTDWINGVTLSGGEPTLSQDLPQFIRWIRSRGLSVKLDTNGSNPRMLEAIIDDIDYIAMDVKCGLERYPEFVRFTDTAAIRESINLIKSRAADYEFRTTVIETVHTVDEMQAIGEAVRDARRYILQPFIPHDDLPDPAYRRMTRTSPDVMDTLAAAIAPYVREVGKKGRQ